jgi:hypothetical protein
MTALSLACGSQPADAIRLASPTLSLGLIAHWNFDEGAGTTVADRSGNRRDGTLTGGTWLNDGHFGSALHIGDGERIVVDPFPDATSSFSVSAWVRINAFTRVSPDDPERWGVIISTEEISAGGWELVLERHLTVPAANFAYWKGEGIGDYFGWTCECMDVGAWTHLVGVVDGDLRLLSLFVDGQLRGSLPTTQGILPGTQALTMGQLPDGGRDLDGDVDEVTVWNRALVQAEVATLARYALPPRP